MFIKPSYLGKVLYFLVKFVFWEKTISKHLLVFFAYTPQLMNFMFNEFVLAKNKQNEIDIDIQRETGLTVAKNNRTNEQKNKHNR